MARLYFDPKRYPTGPGCYLMRGATGQVLYIGKAKNLRRRLSSYFQPHPKERETEQMVRRIASIEIILLNNETESLILENNLIKYHQPLYNRALMDEDSGYSYILLTTEPFPRFVPYRKGRANKELGSPEAEAGARRFGPYINKRFRNVLLKFVSENFQMRTCLVLPHRACLRYHMAKCGGICEGRVSAQVYARAVEQAADFLARQHEDLIREMKIRMMEHADRLEFERAQRIRDQVWALESALEKQVVERDVDHDQDMVYFGKRHVLILEAKHGAIRDLHWLDLEWAGNYGEACEQLLLSRYAHDGPDELIVNRLKSKRRIEAALTAAAGHRVTIRLPTQGVEHDLSQLCELNYAYRVSSLQVE